MYQPLTTGSSQLCFITFALAVLFLGFVNSLLYICYICNVNYVILLIVDQIYDGNMLNIDH